jgi:hypothetical protein
MKFNTVFEGDPQGPTVRSACGFALGPDL